MNISGHERTHRWQRSIFRREWTGVIYATADGGHRCSRERTTNITRVNAPRGSKWMADIAGGHWGHGWTAGGTRRCRTVHGAHRHVWGLSHWWTSLCVHTGGRTQVDMAGPGGVTWLVDMDGEHEKTRNVDKGGRTGGGEGQWDVGGLSQRRDIAGGGWVADTNGHGTMDTGGHERTTNVDSHWTGGLST